MKLLILRKRKRERKKNLAFVIENTPLTHAFLSFPNQSTTGFPSRLRNISFSHLFFYNTIYRGSDVNLKSKPIGIFAYWRWTILVECAKNPATNITVYHTYNNPCFSCNIDLAITKFLVSHTSERRFYDVIDRTVHHVCIMTPSYSNNPKHGQISMVWTLISLILFAESSYVIKRIRHSLTVEIKVFIKLVKGSFNNLFQDSFNRILSQQFTHDRSYSYIYYILC